MKISRRMFLGGVGAITACPLHFGYAGETADGFQLLKAQVVASTLLETAAAQTEQWRFSTDPITVIRAKVGAELKLRFINELPQEIWLHWFGVRGPHNVMSMNIPADPQGVVDCVFTPPDAGTFWFGPLLNASRQREMGLYGLLVVEEAAVSEPLLYDVPLVLDDWRIDGAAKIIDDFDDLQTVIGSGRLGSWFTVNGLYRPHVDVPADRPLRLRLLNAANSRIMQLQFKGAEPLVIALDGQPVKPMPPTLAQLRLAPGQRIDLLLDQGTEPLTLALDLFEDVAEVAYVQRRGTPAALSLPENFALPPNPISTQLELAKAREVPVVLAGGQKGGLKAAFVGDKLLDTRALLEKGMAWAINGVAGPGGAALGQFKHKETIIFAIDNMTSFEQPLHLHGHVWQVLDASPTGEAILPWRDTLVVPAKSQMKVAFVADNSGTWALQSTVAERVDAGMIASFLVE